MKKQDFILGGDSGLETALRSRVRKAIGAKKERVPYLSQLWLHRLGERNTDLGIPEASLLAFLLRHFEHGPIRGVPQVVEWLRWGTRQLRSLRLTAMNRSRN